MQDLKTAQTLDSFIAEVKEREAAVRRQNVRVCDLELFADDRLTVAGDAHAVSAGLLNDLSRLADIPLTYFCKRCDGDLRALSFNHLKEKGISRDSVVLVFERDRLARVVDGTLLPVSRAELLDTIRNSIPAGIDPTQLRVIRPSDDETFDVSIVSPQASCEPRDGDVVVFGVNVRETEKGAIQVHGASFRSSCANDALFRVCDKNEHRLRRPGDKPEKLAEFLGKFKHLSVEAWDQRTANAADLVRMVSVPLLPVKSGGLEDCLRNKPFFIEKKIVNRVMQRVTEETASHGGPATAYDVWNAMSYLGTHGKDVPAAQRFRLRIGAGEIAKNKPRVCSACQQVVLT